MSKMKTFTSTMDPRVRLTLGENGATEFDRDWMTASLQGAAVDMMAMVRGATGIAQVIRRYCAEAQKIRDPRQRAEDLADMICRCFYTRGCRGGKGERDLFYNTFLALFHEFPCLMAHRRMVELIPHYGRWDDLNKLLCRLTTKEGVAKNPRYRRLVAVLVGVQIDQLVKDDQTQAEITQLRAGNLVRDGFWIGEERISALLKQMSLVSKWLPREKKSMDKSNSLAKALARAYARKVGVPETQSRKAYRQVLSRTNGTAGLRTTEVYMAAQDWDGIDLSRVPTACMRIGRKTWLNLMKDGQTERSADPARRRMKARMQQLTQDALDGKGGAKIHGTAQHPHEIVKLLFDHHSGETDETRLLEAQWKDMVRHYTQMAADEGLDFTSSVCVVDVSDSMGGQPMMVAIALGLLLSEIAANLGSPFGNRVITFHSIPTWVIFHEADSLLERVQKLRRAPWGMNTDFEKVYRMIADHGRTHRLTPEEMPKMLWVLSDMQFGVARNSSTPWETHHEILTRYFAQTGQAVCGRPYVLNRMVYWNLRNTSGHPVDSDTEGALLVGGFSPDLMRAILKAKGNEDPDVPDAPALPTPFDGFVAAVTEEFLDPVRLLIAELSQVGEIELDFTGYHFERTVEDAADDGEATDDDAVEDGVAWADDYLPPVADDHDNESDAGSRHVPLPIGWSSRTMLSGSAYYYNHATGESTLTDPRLPTDDDDATPLETPPHDESTRKRLAASLFAEGKITEAEFRTLARM